MRMPSLSVLTVAASALLGTTAAFANPISVGPGGSIVTTETSWETSTQNIGDILQGVITVASINNASSINNPVYSTGGGGQFLSAVFGGFVLRDVAFVGNSFTLSFTGGFLNYYTSATNPLANLALVNSGTVANAIDVVDNGALWESFTAQTIDALNDTLIITGVTQNGSLANVSSSGTSTVFLDRLPGGLGGLVDDTFINPYLSQIADATYQGSANTGQCAAYFINANSPFQICGSDNLSTAVIPEPITLSLFGAGLVGAAALRRRKAKKA
ncbi:MAG: PEP-CTERM sorting domain-containing protein [Rhizomicrobium sp.]